jgi:hypothetical protein
VSTNLQRTRQEGSNILIMLRLYDVTELVPWYGLPCGATEMTILLAGVAIVGGTATILAGWSSLGIASLGLAPFVGSLLAGGTAIALAGLQADRTLRSEADLTNSQA